MKFKDVYDLIDGYAPFSLSDRLCKMMGGWYDNSGAIASIEGDVTGILFSLDLTDLAVERAKEVGANVIVTHHPAIWDPIKRVSGTLLKAISGGIGVISCHLNLDCAEKGIDYYFAQGIGAKEQEIITKITDKEGYGRRFFLGKSLKEIRRHAEEVFNTTVLCYGYDDMHVNTAASFCGAGLDGDYAKTDCQLLCSSDVPHHVICDVVSQGKALMVFTHYASEKYGLMKLYEGFSSLEGFDKNVKLYFFDDKRLF